MRYIAEASEIVRRKWRTTGRGWKVFLAIGIVIAGLIGLLCFIVWAFVKFLGSLSVGKAQNVGLYFPARRR